MLFTILGMEEFPFQISTVKAVMEAFGQKNTEIDFETFQHLWRYVFDWQKCFRRFDTNKSGSIENQELHSALTSFGYTISNTLCQLLIQRFDRTGKNEILFDDFIRCCLILHVSLFQFSSFI